MTRRTDAIQRLRSLWAQLDPEAESAVANVATRRMLRQLKEIDFGAGLTEQAAARCIHDLASEIEQLNERVAELERELAALLAGPGRPFTDLRGAGLATTVTLIAESGDVRRFRSDAAYARYGGSAPIPCGSGSTAGRHRLHQGGNRQVNACLDRIAVTQARVDPERAPSSSGSWPRGRRNERPAQPRNATSPASSTAASPSGPNGRYPLPT